MALFVCLQEGERQGPTFSSCCEVINTKSAHNWMRHKRQSRPWVKNTFPFVLIALIICSVCGAPSLPFLCQHGRAKARSTAANISRVQKRNNINSEYKGAAGVKEVVEERAEKMKTNRSIQSKSSTLYKICQGKCTEGNRLSHQLMRAGFEISWLSRACEASWIPCNAWSNSKYLIYLRHSSELRENPSEQPTIASITQFMNNPCFGFV